jgi:O-antigen/teichoic acid export membrane protein
MYCYSYYNNVGFPFKFKINGPVYSQAVRYGMPLAASSILTYFMAGFDRYVIGYYFGTEKVAEYAVVFNYCSYPIEPVKNVFMATYIPLIMNTWNKGDTSGKPMSDYISTYFWVVSPLIFGLFATENEGIKLLAGDKYHSLPGIVPLLALAMSVGGMSFIFTGGLLFKGMSKVILNLTALCGLLNIILNVCLIGKLGVYGAAISSFISYVSFSIIAYSFSKKYLEYSIPYKQIFLAIVSGSIMAFGIKMIPSSIVDLQPLLIKICVGCVIYASCILLFSNQIIRSIKSMLTPKTNKDF